MEAIGKIPISHRPPITECLLDNVSLNVDTIHLFHIFPDIQSFH